MLPRLQKLVKQSYQNLNRRGKFHNLQQGREPPMDIELVYMDGKNAVKKRFLVLHGMCIVPEALVAMMRFLMYQAVSARLKTLPTMQRPLYCCQRFGGGS